MADNEDALASFMSITGAESATALQYLELTNWKLDEAVNLFMESGAQSHGAGSASGLPPPAPMGSAYGMEDEIRAPDPSKRQRLFGDSYENVPVRRLHEQYRDFAAESIAAINAASQSPAINSAFGPSDATDESERSRDLSSLFQPPVNLMFKGTYSEARALAKNEGKWLLVNIQDEIVFASHMLNRDTWSNDVVQNVVASGYVFWQNHWVSDHGKKFCTLYQIERDLLPIIAIVNPRTGEIAQQWTGFVEPETLTERLSDFCFTHFLDSDESTPNGAAGRRDLTEASEEDQLAAAIAASMESAGEDSDDFHDADADDEEEKTEEVVVDTFVEQMPSEPADGSPDVTRVQIRTPDGSRLTRRFLKTDPMSLLWVFIKEQIPEARSRAFEVRTAFPPAQVEFNEAESIADRKLENASLMVKWT